MNSEYIKRQSEWQLLNDCYDEVIKEKKEEYLPMPIGQKQDPNYGTQRYNNFLALAKYYNYFKQSVDNFVNCIMRKPAVITLPTSIDYLLNNCNYDNESLEMCLNEIYQEQLKTGRIGILADVTEKNIFKIITYKALDVIDWKNIFIDGEKKLVYVVIREDESYRILFLDETYKTCLIPSKEYEKIKTRILKKKEIDFDYIYSNYEVIEPQYTGASLSFIPFTFANITHTRTETEQPFLLNQANLSIGLYQLDADHSLLCHKQAFSLLFGKGIQSSDKSQLVDIDGVFTVDTVDADMKFVGVSGAGLSEVRQEKENLKKEVASFGIIAQDKNVQESENSLKIRIQLNTDKLISISRTGAKALEWILETIAIWSGANSEEVIIEPNFDFRTETEKTAELLNMSELYKQGTITNYDFWKWQFKNNYTNYNYEEWKTEIENEEIENNNEIENETERTA